MNRNSEDVPHLDTKAARRRRQVLEAAGQCFRCHGFHGCGMADVTLKQGIETTLRARLPEIKAVRDATDHASGDNPYYRGPQGASAVG